MMNEQKHIGIELEFAGVSLEETAQLVQQNFGGEINKTSNAEITVENTKLGDFRVEIDAKIIKELSQDIKDKKQNYDQTTIGIIDKLMHKIVDKTLEHVTDLSRQIVPVEVVSPPLKEADLSKMDDLRNDLQKAMAKGTGQSFYYAFGTHINPEIPEQELDDPSLILNHMRAFVVLYPLLLKWHRVDTSRRLSNYITLYGEGYLETLMRPDYNPNKTQMIRDYYYHNPSRNRALDMLPMFKHLKPKLIKSLYGEDSLIKARPTFHYRLPNCNISNPDWRIMDEYKIWQKVEQLARQSKLLKSLMEQWYDDHNNRPLSFLSHSNEWLTTLGTKIDPPNSLHDQPYKD